MKVNINPDTCKKEPLKSFGRPYIEYYKACRIIFPVRAFSTKGSFIIFEIYEYFKGPADKRQSFLILPELANDISASKYNLIKSAIKFP